MVIADDPSVSKPKQNHQPTTAALDALTDTEWRILKWIAAGQSNARIARQLHTSIEMVETHRFRLLRMTEALRRF